MSVAYSPRGAARGNYCQLIGILKEYVPESVARGIISHALTRTGVSEQTLEQGVISTRLLEALYRGVDLFLDVPARKQECKDRICVISSMKASEKPAAPACGKPEQIAIDREDDIVTARNRARFMAEDLGFNKTDQIKIATAVSELARNIFKYAGRGVIAVEPLSSPRPGIKIVSQDQGNGIPNLDEIMSGGYRSKTGLGLGILGCKRLMDEFNLETGPGKGTKITLVKLKI